MLVRCLLAFTFIGLVSSCSSVPKTTQAKQIPLKDFFKNPEVAGYRISPDGLWLAYLKPYKSRLNVFVKPVNGGAEKRLTSQVDRDIRIFMWKENNTILFSRDFGGDENFHIFSVDITGGKEKDLTPFPETRAHVIADLDGVDADHIVVGLNKRDKKVFDAYRLNVKTGAMTLIAQNPGNFTEWLTDHNGQLRVAMAKDGVNTKIFYRETEKQKFKKIIENNFRVSTDPVLFTSDNKNLYIVSNQNRDKEALIIFDPRTRREVKEVFAHPEVDVSAQITYSKKNKELIAARYITWRPELHFFDQTFAATHKKLSETLSGLEVTFASFNRDEDKLVVRTYSDRSMGDFYLYDVKTEKLQHLATVSPWLNKDDLVEMKPITYKSRDGLTIHGYLTLPKGDVQKNLPVVVNPHGGPWHRDVWGYDPEAQFLANRGYAVLQMNFRGSTGYGRKFWEASFKQWGLAMQNDVTDGVKHLIDQGIADPKRVCIYGGSYGGYAVLAGLAFTPELYACGVDYVGVSNIFTLMETIPPYWEPMRQQFYEMVGHPEKDKDLLKAASPVFHVDRMRAPLFVAQGAKDPRVKKAESDQIVDALKKRGVDVPYLVKENEGHGFHNEENRFDFYSKMEEFLGRHLTK